PPAFRTQAIGVYWALRSVGVMFAPLVGGLLWLANPDALLWVAGGVGIAGALWFYLGFAGAEEGVAAVPSGCSAAAGAVQPGRSGRRRIQGVDRQADGDRLAVPEPEVGHRLGPVRRPVAEVERPGLVRLERVPPSGDVAAVPLGGVADHWQGGREVAAAD